MTFIKKVYGVLPLLLLMTVAACGSGGHLTHPVTITSSSTLPQGVVSTPYSTSLAATGGTAPYTWSVKSCSGACNTGLGFSSSGVLAGTPVNTGTSTFSFAVTDANGQTASASPSITIAAAPTTPAAVTITSPSTLPSGVVSTPYSTSLAATGGTAPYTWGIKSCSGTCNTGLGFSSSGVLAGTPVNTGTSTFSFAVTDANGQTASASPSITIAAAPTTPTAVTITSPSTLPSGVVSTPYSTSLTATGGTSPYTWSIKSCSGACNTGLSFSSSGVLAGTPVNTGTSTFSFAVTDANGQTASASPSITIAAAPATPAAVTITSPSTLPSGTVSTPYSTSLAATGGTAPYTWALKSCSGTCNTSLGLSASGVLSGTPTTSGTSTYNVAVTDANAQTASASLTLVIASATTSVTITSPSTLPSGTVSAPYSTSLTATGGTTPYTWALKSCSGTCNPGITLSSSGVLSGTPTTSGTSTYNVAVTDAKAQTASASVTLVIAAATTSTGNTYYVTPTGNDSNPCTQLGPCATPDHAFNIASPGDTVQVAAGTYDYGSSPAQFSQSGTAGKYITVTCTTRGACKIQNSVTGNSTVVYLSGSYMTFDGFEVTNTSSAGNNLGLYVTSSFVNITHNTIHHIETDCGQNGGGGIQIAGSGSSNSDLHNITIDGNLIYDINYVGGNPSCTSSTVQADGILAETAGTALQVTNNVVYHTSGGWGILVGNSNATFNNVTSMIANNTVFSTTGGIIIMSGNGTTISNNIVADTGQSTGRCGISAPQGVSVTYFNNDLWNNSGGNYCLEWGTSDQSVHSGDISVDPALGTTFVNWKADGSGDYREKAGSPTVDRGSSTGASTDFNGSARPLGAANDIGAYESY